MLHSHVCMYVFMYLSVHVCIDACMNAVALLVCYIIIRTRRDEYVMRQKRIAQQVQEK